MNLRTMTAVIAVAALAHGMPAFASEGSVDGLIAPNNPGFTQLPDIDQTADANAPAGGSSYLFIAGSAFTPRTSGQVVTYPGGGCAYSNSALTTSLELPTGTSVTGVRLYYYSVDPAQKVGMFFTSYTGDGNLTDELTRTSTFSSGYSDQYFSLATSVVISNLNRAYVLTGTMDTGTRLCGMRVFYSN